MNDLSGSEYLYVVTAVNYFLLDNVCRHLSKKLGIMQQNLGF